MQNRDANRHPGIMRVMKVDSEFAGILVAVGLLVMGPSVSILADGLCWERLGSASRLLCCSGSRGGATDLALLTKKQVLRFAQRL
jgi:hypothetical protein